MKKNPAKNIIEDFGGLTVFNRGSRRATKQNKRNSMLTPMLGEITGSIHVGLAGLGSAIGVALVGMKASEAVGRNPGAFGRIITLAVLGMALSEAIVFYAIYLVR